MRNQWISTSRLKPGPVVSGVRPLINLVAFRLGRQVMAIPLEPVLQIIPMVTIIPIPNMKRPLLGIINVRGQAVPVSDLRQLLGLEEHSLKLYTPIILAEIDGRTVGLVVDDVVNVISIPQEEVTGFEHILPGGVGEVSILLGLGRLNGSLLPIIDPERLFLPEEVAVLEKVNDALPTFEIPAADTKRDGRDRLTDFDFLTLPVSETPTSGEAFQVPAAPTNGGAAPIRAVSVPDGGEESPEYATEAAGPSSQPAVDEDPLAPAPQKKAPGRPRRKKSTTGPLHEGGSPA